MEDATLNKLAKYVQNQLGIQTLECNYDINNEKCIECSRRIKSKPKLKIIKEGNSKE